ncbi:hypothetical protein V6Z11_A05G359100 [Gossypium hirsutum]
MSIFLAPKGVIDDIQAMLSRTWWAGKDKGRFWTMIPWKTLCKPKGMDGLGIRDVRLFNIALLGRQVWRLLNNTDSLCFKVLSSKYFPDGNIFHAKKVDKASFTWSSVAAAAKVFKDGFGWQSVKDLWHVDNRSWDVNKVKQVYGPDWGDKICDIPIGDVVSLLMVAVERNGIRPSQMFLESVMEARHFTEDSGIYVASGT